MSFEFIIIIVIVYYLRRSLKTALTMPQWNKQLLWLMYASFAFGIAQLSVGSFYTIGQWLSIIMLGGLLYVISSNEAFKTARFLITAILPYLVVSFVEEAVKLVSKSFYNKWSDWGDIAETFAVIWGIGTWIVTRKQQKELTQAREKALKEEQNNKIITAMKVDLEVQVAERTAELTQQKEELENALNELKSTQAQLIQSEKMASLGELTAGIAHEIQNPLNFVNNFSEVNNEIIEELKEHKVNGQSNGEADELLNDIFQNNEKIAFHGKRADAIVKGMLQHSRKNTGIKEATDINALCDEYLRLSYHGLRAKDKSFNADFKTDFDTSISKINIVPQDVGRVILNLVNNAFYAVSDKKKTADETYKPMVLIQTKKAGDDIEIFVKDNGKGIPANVLDKIFQPFFTTKPTGQGTGLGLSLAYDIITKEHNGTIKAESKEGEGTVFIIELPLS